MTAKILYMSKNHLCIHSHDTESIKGQGPFNSLRDITATLTGAILVLNVLFVEWVFIHVENVWIFSSMVPSLAPWSISLKFSLIFQFHQMLFSFWNIVLSAWLQQSEYVGSCRRYWNKISQPSPITFTRTWKIFI